MRQLGPGDTGDRQEQEELILEGSLQEPRELEADDDHFMKYSILHRDGLGTKVQCGLQPALAGTLPRASTASAGIADSGAPPPSILSSALLSSPVSPLRLPGAAFAHCTSRLAQCLLPTDSAFPSPVLFCMSVCLFTWVMSCFLPLRLAQEEVRVRVPKPEVSGGRMGAQIVKRASLKRGKQ